MVWYVMVWLSYGMVFLCYAKIKKIYMIWYEFLWYVMTFEVRSFFHKRDLISLHVQNMIYMFSF